MNFHHIINRHFLPRRSVIGSQKHNHPFNCIDLPYFPCVFLIFSTIFQQISHEEYNRNLRMMPILDHIIDEDKLLIQQDLLAF